VLAPTGRYAGAIRQQASCRDLSLSLSLSLTPQFVFPPGVHLEFKEVNVMYLLYIPGFYTCSAFWGDKFILYTFFFYIFLYFLMLSFYHLEIVCTYFLMFMIIFFFFFFDCRRTATTFWGVENIIFEARKSKFEERRCSLREV